MPKKNNKFQSIGAIKTAKNGLPAVCLFISFVGASVQAAVLEEVIVTSQKRSENLTVKSDNLSL
jgi:hypothetical protein